MDNNFWFGIIKEYYQLSLYADSDLDTFVQAKWITAEDKTNIIASKATQTNV